MNEASCGQVPHQVDRAGELEDDDVARPAPEHLEGESLAVPNGITHLDIAHDARLPEISTPANERRVERAPVAHPMRQFARCVSE